MTQEAFKTWWYTEGSQAPYTHHDCEEHTMRMCEIAWANGAYKALAEHAMSEVQRLGQEIEQEPAGWEVGVVDGVVTRRLAPPQRKPLSAEQVSEICAEWTDENGNTNSFGRRQIARAIEAAHGIKGDA